MCVKIIPACLSCRCHSTSVGNSALGMKEEGLREAGQRASTLLGLSLSRMVAVWRTVNLDLSCSSQPSSGPAWGKLGIYIRGSTPPPHLASWFRAKHPVGMQPHVEQNGTLRFKEKRALQGLDSRLISLGHQIALTNDILTN